MRSVFRRHESGPEHRISFAHGLGLSAIAEALKGDDAEAKLALAEARRLNPKLTIKWFAEHSPGLPPPIFVEGWRKAGLPEE